MSSDKWPRKVLLLYEGADFGGDFDTSFVNGFKAHGCEVTCIQRGYPWPPVFDLVLGYGPFTLQEGSILPVARQLLALPPAHRPVFVWWLTEGTPNPRYPRWFVSGASRLRLRVDRLLAHDTSSSSQRWRDLALRGHRLRIFGELRWARERDLLDLLVITCQSRADYYRRWGFDPLVAPLGYDPVYGEDLGLQRDIAVAFIGNTAAQRRRRLLPKLFQEFEQRGIEVEVKPHLYDEARTEFLNRTRILLNVLREPEDFVGQRFMLAAANKALTITEPILDHAPFIPDRHIVVAGLDEIADTVQFYLTHENVRREIAEKAHHFVTQDLSITKMIGSILDQARLVRASRRTF